MLIPADRVYKIRFLTGGLPVEAQGLEPCPQGLKGPLLPVTPCFRSNTARIRTWNAQGLSLSPLPIGLRCRVSGDHAWSSRSSGGRNRTLVHQVQSLAGQPAATPESASVRARQATNLRGAIPYCPFCLVDPHYDSDLGQVLADLKWRVRESNPSEVACKASVRSHADSP